MNENSLLSVIVPVYNAQPWLSQCVDSILSQEDENIQLILVNDGSTDGSEEICKRYLCDHRVQYYYKENAGVSSARNLGIRKAEGEWLLFADADDRFLPGTFAQIRKHMDLNADGIFFHYVVPGRQSAFSAEVTGEKASDVLLVSLDRLYYRNRLKTKMQITDRLLMTCWAKLYRKSVIAEHGIVFPEKLRISEDLWFNVLFLKETPQVTMVDIPIYSYSVNQESVTHSGDEKRVQQKAEVVSYFLEQELPHPFQEAKNRYVLRLLMDMNAEPLKQIDRTKILDVLKNHEHALMLLENTHWSDGNFQKRYYTTCFALWKGKQYRLAFLLGQGYHALKKAKKH